LTYTLLLFAAPAALTAQVGTPRPARIDLGVGAHVGLVVGDDTDFLDSGVGPWARVRWRSGTTAFGLELSGAWLPLVEDTDARTRARADNAILTLLAGPTLSTDLGSVTLWGGALLGVVGVRWSHELPARSSRGTDWSFGWRSAAGADVRVSHRIALGAEAGVTRVGTLSFARAPATDTGPPVGLVERAVSLLTVRIGFTIER
jgi:opacity protein-like surface antigen